MTNADTVTPVISPAELLLAGSLDVGEGGGEMVVGMSVKVVVCGQSLFAVGHIQYMQRQEQYS